MPNLPSSGERGWEGGGGSFLYGELKLIMITNYRHLKKHFLPVQNEKFTWISADEYGTLEKRDQEYLELVCNIRNAWSPKKWEHRARSAKSAAR